MLHPAVGTDLAEVEQLRAFLNSVLIHDGYEIVQTGEISGAPVFEGRRIGSGVRGSMKNIIFAEQRANRHCAHRAPDPVSTVRRPG
jgi:hypothetical protein